MYHNVTCNQGSAILTMHCNFALQLPLESVRPPVEEEGGYTGVAAPKRKRVQETPVVEEAPPKVRIVVLWLLSSGRAWP